MRVMLVIEDTDESGDFDYLIGLIKRSGYRILEFKVLE